MSQRPGLMSMVSECGPEKAVPLVPQRDGAATSIQRLRGLERAPLTQPKPSRGQLTHPSVEASIYKGPKPPDRPGRGGPSAPFFYS